MNKELRTILEQAKQKYAGEGFLILGVFGSRAREDFTSESDLDILYKLGQRFYKEYTGWRAIVYLEEIKEDLSLLFSLNVDIANINSLKSVGKKYILPETVYVD